MPNSQPAKRVIPEMIYSRRFSSLKEHFLHLISDIFNPQLNVDINCQSLTPHEPTSPKIENIDMERVTKLTHVAPNTGNAAIDRVVDIDLLYILVRKYPQLAKTAFDDLHQSFKQRWNNLNSAFDSQPTLKALMDGAKQRPEYVEQRQAEKHFHFVTAPRFLNDFVQDAAKGKRRYTSQQVLDYLTSRGKCDQSVLSDSQPANLPIASVTTVDKTAAQLRAESKEPSVKVPECPQASVTPISKEQKPTVEPVVPQQTYTDSFFNGALYGGLNTLRRGVVNHFSHRHNFSGFSRHATQVMVGAMVNYAITKDISFSVITAVVEEVLNKVITKISPSLAVAGNLLYSARNTGWHAVTTMAGGFAATFAARKIMQTVGVNMDETNSKPALRG